MLSKSCICRIKRKYWQTKAGSYRFKNRLCFRENAKIIIKYFLGNSEEGNEQAIKRISLMKKSSSGNSFCRGKNKTTLFFLIKLSQQQDSPAQIKQNQLSQNYLHSYPASLNASYFLTTSLPPSIELKLASELFKIFVKKLVSDF